MNERIQRQRQPDPAVGPRRRRLPLGRSHPDLEAALDRVRLATDQAARRERDPVRFVHLFAAPADRELVGLTASALAFGQVATILQKQQELLDRLQGDPSGYARRPEALRKALAGFVHRVYRGEDLGDLLLGAAAVQDAHGSLGGAFATFFASHGTLQPALGDFVAAIDRGARRIPVGERTRGSKHLLPDPAANSACKRLALFLRWMVRPDDGVDTGLWSGLLPASVLVIPLDTHIHRVALNLGLTGRRDGSWTTAVEITAALARYCPEDPVRYDFALCHLGMSLRCPSRREAALCEGCGVKPVCLHWGSRGRKRL